MTILFLIYWVAGYWAAGEVIYKNKIIIEYRIGTLFFRKIILGLMFGWILIPFAIIRNILHI